VHTTTTHARTATRSASPHSQTKHLSQTAQHAEAGEGRRGSPTSCHRPTRRYNTSERKFRNFLVLLSSSSCSSLEPRSSHGMHDTLVRDAHTRFSLPQETNTTTLCSAQSQRIIDSGLKKHKQKTKKAKKRVNFLFYSAEEGSKKFVCMRNHCGHEWACVCGRVCAARSTTHQAAVRGNHSPPVASGNVCAAVGECALWERKPWQ